MRDSSWQRRASTCSRLLERVFYTNARNDLPRIQVFGQNPDSTGLRSGGHYQSIPKVDIPDELAACLAPPGEDLSRSVLEALGLEAYRRPRISGYQLRQFLGMRSRWELDHFLKLHGVCDYNVDDFEKDWATIREFRKQRIG